MSHPPPVRPIPTRVVLFVDGQNLYHRCKACFGPGWIHPRRLGEALIKEDTANSPGTRVLSQVRYYTGIHNRARHPNRWETMSRRLAAWGADGVHVETITLRYDPDGKAREKGIDVRIALDLIRLGRKGLFDVAVIVSEDSDLDEAVREVLELRDHERWMAVENALPYSESRKPRWLPSVPRRRLITAEMFKDLVDHRNFAEVVELELPLEGPGL